MVINFLCLPLYKFADELQKKERETVNRLSPYVKHIKQTFKGDERFMMLAAYYRIEGYNPTYALRSSLSILLEIPFFIAAYHYLHNCEYLENVRFLMIQNLSKPDALLFGANILPAIMTAINIISGLVYAQESTLKDKARLVGVALVFLVLLYNSPSGLVLYWIFNNTFSLCKNIIARTGHGKAVLYLLLIAFFASCSFYLYNENIRHSVKIAVILLTCLIVLIPLELKMFRKAAARLPFRPLLENLPQNEITAVTLLSGLATAVTAGFVLPSLIISSSPSEFSFLGKTDDPQIYILRTFSVFLGFFVVWPSVVYFTMPRKHRTAFSLVMVLLCSCSIMNIFVFKHDYGIINNLFNLDDVTILRHLPPFLSILPLLSLLATLCAAVFAYTKRSPATIRNLLLSVCAGSFLFALTRLPAIHKGYSSYKEIRSLNSTPTASMSSGTNTGLITPIFRLSKTGKNIVVLFLDRAISSFFPYVLEEIPDLRKKFEGFVYYPNALSFSRNTDNASPAMMAGYEYIPKRLNERTDLTLREKQNEANLVLPRLFSQNGFSASVINPPLSNYLEHGDLSPFSEFPEINAMETYGKYSSIYKEEKQIGDELKSGADELCRKGMVDFCCMRLMNPLFRFSFYGNCRWPIPNADTFYDIFSGLYYLDKLTTFSFGNGNCQNGTYTFIGSDVTHTPNYLDENYERVIGSNNQSCIYPSSTPLVLKHYHVNVAAMMQLAKWFDFLRDNGVYDNTRIVVVSDHGYDFSVEGFSSFGDTRNLTKFNILLLFKDFASTEDLRIDNSFMTNADTAFLAAGSLGIEMVNPFTGSQMRQDKENGIEVYPTYGLEWSPGYMRDKTQFTLADGFHVSGNIFNRKNWKPIE